MGRYKRHLRAMKKHKQDTALDAVAQIVEEQKPGPQTIEIATRERSIDFLSSVMNALPNPDPVLKKRGVDISVYETLSYDSRVRAVVSSRKAPVKSMEWQLTGEDVPEDIMAFYKNVFDSYKMADLISEILDAWLYGYKPIEILWSHVDGKVVPTGFVPKPPRWFRYDDENRLRMITMANMIQGELLPSNKFIVASNEQSYDNPYGIPVLSACFWPVTFRKNGLKFWTIFLEKYGQPFLLAHAEEGAQSERITEIADMLDNMVSDAIAVVPANYKVELLESKEGKSGADSFHKAYLDFMNMEIEMAVLGTNLTTEVSGGSYAAAQSHMAVRDDIVEGDQFITEQAFNELIELTHSFNFLGKPRPWFKLFREEKIDKNRAVRDMNLTKTGVRFSKMYYQRAYNLTEEEFEVGEPPKLRVGV